MFGVPITMTRFAYIVATLAASAWAWLGWMHVFRRHRVLDWVQAHHMVHRGGPLYDRIWGWFAMALGSTGAIVGLLSLVGVLKAGAPNP